MANAKQVVYGFCKDPTESRTLRIIVAEKDSQRFHGDQTELTKEDVEAFFNNSRDICEKAQQCSTCPIYESDRSCYFRTGEISSENFAYAMSYRR